ncbi:hypothetical protein [Synechococcus sp. CCY9201]|uniref:hypothetical protein n=1 Tax=Synechococcus sp. CCY9201 TaxID=174697 RepID=UPI002B1FD3DD|nr:hypothetical protein [Synechococcus sp. CCY9201]
MSDLHQVVPWGRSLSDYTAMSSLADADMAVRILGCGDRPLSFNAEATRQGARILSFDPIYRFDKADIESRIAATYEHVIDQVRQNQDEFR